MSPLLETDPRLSSPFQGEELRWTITTEILRPVGATRSLPLEGGGQAEICLRTSNSHRKNTDH